MAKSNKYPRFVPTSIENHDIVGKIKIYEFKKFPTPNGDGCQSSFFRNGAKVNNPNQFGIKVFNTSIEAFAAYQRQRLAAKEGLAPPVGVMVRWIVRATVKGSVQTYNRWGYETCIADTSDNAVNLAMLLGSDIIRNDYENFMQGYSPRGHLYSPSSVRAFWEMVDEHFNELGYDFHNALEDADDVDCLRARLSIIDISGTQYDDISSVDDIGSAAWKNNRLRLGEVIEPEDDMYMGGDLHCGNIGMWNDHPVAIDFGYHSSCPYFRNLEEKSYIRSVESSDLTEWGHASRERHSQMARA
jgi:hypothetical protein